MSGIAGIFDTCGTREIDRQLIHAMNQVQRHRGPDAETIHIEPGLSFGLQKLAISDNSSEHSLEPKEHGHIIIAFDGEIYNLHQLAAELTAQGHPLDQNTPVEIIAQAWQVWGKRCVEHFNGKFAFGLWDRHQQTLFMARDRLGIKPFFYTLLNNGLLIFSSELKALQTHPDFDKALNSEAIEDYFAYGYVPEPKTIFKNTFKLNPGHVLALQRGSLTLRSQKFWDVPFKPHTSTLSEQETAEELIVRLRQAVKSRLVNQVPFGAFLSGGVDSSAIVAMMAGLVKEPVTTFAVSFADPDFNESDYAQMVADRYQTRHFTEQVAQDDFDLIDQLAVLYDEPYADSSAMPTYRACELAKKRVAVAFSGDAGDENFAGYRRYRWFMLEERLRSKLPLAVRRPLFGLLGTIYPKADWAPRFLRAKTTFEALARDAVEGYFHGVSIMDNRLRQQLFTTDFIQNLQGYQAIEVFRDHASKSPTRDPLSLIQYLDMKTYLVGDVLTKVDRASAAHALDVRIPLLDHELVEWISGLPASLKLHRQESKYIFKKSLEPWLPHDVLYRRKMGFGVPLASWFRGPLRERVRAALLDKTMADTGIFNMDFIRKMLDQHQSGRRDFSAPIWTLLMFEAFMRHNINSKNTANIN